MNADGKRMGPLDRLAAMLLRGHYHVYIGQEATAVSACAGLGPYDFGFSTRRTHGHLLARGAAPTCRVSTRDVPIPYRAELEAELIVSTEKIVAGALRVMQT